MRAPTGVRRVYRSLRYRTSPQVCFLDLGHDVDRTILVVGTARSGTTWLAEMLNPRNRQRLIFEPFNTGRSQVVPADFIWGEYVEPGTSSPSLQASFDRILSGRVRSPWIDRFNGSRLATHRIVKCIAVTNLLPWLQERYPLLPIVYIVRHPFAVAESLSALAAREGRSRGDWHRHLSVLDEMVNRAGLLEGPLAGHPKVPAIQSSLRSGFTKSVLRWCLENFVPLRMLRPTTNLTTVTYEGLLTASPEQLRGLIPLLPESKGLDARVRRPSVTDFRQRAVVHTAEGNDRRQLMTRWTDTVSADEIEIGLGLLESFGLDHVYGASPLPRLASADLIKSAR